MKTENHKDRRDRTSNKQWKNCQKNTGSISRSGDARLIIRDIDDIPPAFIVKRDLTNQGMQQRVIKCMSKLIHAFFVSTYRREKRFQNQMIRVINKWQVNSDTVCACVRVQDLSHVQVIRFRNHLRKAWNTTWCPDHPSKEAKPVNAYWYLVIQLVRDVIHCCYWGHNPNTVICCRFFPGDNDLRNERGQPSIFSASNRCCFQMSFDFSICFKYFKWFWNIKEA